MVARLITVHNAEVNTASISIRTLQIAGKQVTMGVFRQLIVEPIVDNQGRSLRGIGWGHVNYLIDYELFTPGDIHLVWQRAGELRRCMVRQPYELHPFVPERLPLPRSSYTLEKLANYDAAQTAAQEKHETRIALLTRYNALVAPLFDLPQLFIAV